MYLIDIHDDDRNFEATIGPFAENPTPAQAIAAVRKHTEGRHHLGYNFTVYSIGEVLPLPSPSEDDIRLAKECPDGYGYVYFETE
jgi:hypothetical protein